MQKQWLKTLSKFVKLAIFGLSLSANAAEISATVVVRNSRGKLVQETRILKDLNSSLNFEGPYFKIVKGTSNDAISTDPKDEGSDAASADLKLRAATAYYHYSLARDYAKSLTHYPSPNIDRQLVVRIEMSNQYSRSIHFAPDSHIINNARTIGPSDDFLADGVEPWNAETWYHKAELKTRPSTAAHVGGQLSSSQFSDVVLTQLLAQDFQTLSGAVANHRFYPEQHLTSMLFSIGLSELLPKVLGFGLKKIKTKEKLDTVMIPEIIYHEYGHILFGHQLGFQISTQILEGYPNYFASKVSGMKTLAGRDGKFGRGFTGKRSSAKTLYSFDQESFSQAIYGSFTFSVLVQLEKALGDEGEQIIFQALNYLNADSRLNLDFPRAISHAIDDVSAYPTSQKLAAQALFDSRGL